ncbi:ATP-binding protein [Schinkia azotoformans]|uniref:DnaC phage replication protein n=1 Tax=Schinkia azotoformans LMG 9581 TaxID=1131731 RepID=K6DH97_SCHAZ|nr:ATP-binding protein [Schinkia azotoformans]EKN67463.1 DnaC phage replication protein [Schinkia azotoformans LMG 9581]MEC1637758.1 ATP-binding protein [Schinkia azotoformans]MEC1944993.1 ATP-binding protein [Schinkia azotoformans]
MKRVDKVIEQLLEDTFPGGEIKTIEKTVCSGCSEQVTIKQIPVLGGINKGKIQQFKIGCKCADIELADKIKKENESLKIDKVFKYFDKYSLINLDLTKASFESFEAQDPSQNIAWQSCVQYCLNFNKDRPENLILYGEPGRGKSHLGVSITKVMMEKHHASSLFINVPKLITLIKESFNRNGSSDLSSYDILSMMREIDVLVLDDLGAELGSDYDIKFIFELLDDRMGKHTVITTNLNFAGFEDQFGKRNTSRVVRNATVLKVEGPDYRFKSAQNIKNWR